MELNPLNINSFTLEIVRIPIIKYTVQSIEFPSVSLPEVKQPTPFQTINQVGDHIVHDELSFTFIVDKKMNNYKVLYFWMRSLAFPEKFEEFEKFINGIVNDDNMVSTNLSKRLNQYSDIIITLLSNQKNPIIRYRIIDAFPVSLSGFNVDITNSDTQPITSTCSMKFTGFEIESV